MSGYLAPAKKMHFVEGRAGGSRGASVAPVSTSGCCSTGCHAHSAPVLSWGCSSGGPPLLPCPHSQFSSVAQSRPTLCDPMNRSTPGLPVHHQFPEFTQTHVHRVSDAIQPSHPLSSPSPPAPNPSQHQSLPMSQLFA